MIPPHRLPTARHATLLALTLAVLFAGPATGRSITIDTVTVGKPGNAADTTGYGAVSYIYNIGRTEVNLSQYSAFLNAVASTDTYNLYNTNLASNPNVAGINRGGTSGSYSYSVIGNGNRPVTYITWFNAARFANWMSNGQPTGAQGNSTTEDGTYTLSGATSGSGFTKNEVNPNTGAASTWWIPTVDEWYKAAFHEPGAPSDDYWDYATRSDTAPGNLVGGTANQANYFSGCFSLTRNATYDSAQDYLANGGAYSASASFHGTFDQSGSVWEWNDQIVGDNRGVLGGSWSSNSPDIKANGGFSAILPSQDSVTTGGDLGFRLATVPEPSTALLALLGLAAGLLLAGRKKKRA